MSYTVTNILITDKEVIDYMLNKEGSFDFNKLFSYTGNQDDNGIYIDAEMAAEELYCTGRIEDATKKDFPELEGEELEQAITFFNNKIETGYFHSDEFNLDKWGTSWNAQDQRRKSDNKIQFDVSGITPFPIFIELSERFPDSVLSIIFSGESIGDYCGRYVLKAGEILIEDTSFDWENLTENERENWRKLACKIWEIDYEEYSKRETFED